MIQTNSTEKNRPHFRMLTDDQIFELVRATFGLMEKVGFNVLHPDARTMLKKAGAVVSGDRVKDTATRVREEIQRIIETHKPLPLEDKTLERLEKIKLRGEKELTPFISHPALRDGN